MTQQNIAGAVETVEKLVSHLHPEGSFDPADHEVPKGLEEVWRFTPLKRLRGIHDSADLSGDAFEIKVVGDDRIVAGSVASDDASKGSSGYVPTDRISARAWAAAENVFKVTVPKDVVIDEPSAITFRGTDAEKAAAGHLVVEAKAFSRSVIVVDYVGSSTWAENVELVVEDGAHLTFVTILDWDDDAVHATHHHALVGRDATLRHVVVTLGGDLVRLSASVEYAGVGGDVEMLGVYFADAGQHLEHRLFVDHNNPRGRSKVDYRGALQGQDAHTVWIGDVLIRKEGTGIETYESNDNLILTGGARADSVPNLEIETGEIEGAGHASTTGRFDDNHLFYLQSRGIPEDQARRLVVHGFFNSIVRRIGVEAVEERLLHAVEKELSQTLGALDE